MCCVCYVCTDHPDDPYGNNRDARTPTDCLIAYCSMMKKERGLTPSVDEKAPARTVRIISAYFGVRLGRRVSFPPRSIDPTNAHSMLNPTPMHPQTKQQGHGPALENCPYGDQISIMRVAAEDAKGCVRE